MIVKVSLTQKDFKEISKYMHIIVDTREDENKDIIKFFKRRKIPIIRKKLDFGDYSFGISKNPIFEKLGINEPISFENRIAIETKMSIDEISGNLTQERERFKDEFTRAIAKGCEMHVIVENGTLNDIYNHNYRTKFNEKAFINSIISFESKYNLKIHFLSSDFSGYHIYQPFLIYLKNFMSE